MQTGLFEGAFGSNRQSINPFSLSPSHVFGTAILYEDGACLSSTPPPLSLSGATKSPSPKEKFFSRAGSENRVPVTLFSVKMVFFFLCKGNVKDG